MMPAPLLINDVFWTFQGEGQFAGHRALFVRMPYCNLSCSWCDTEFNTYKKWEPLELAKVATSEKARLAVITGGEPMLNKNTPRVIEILKGAGFFISCETNGTAPILDGVDFATVSPKRFTEEKGMKPYFVCDQAFARASEFKYVVDAQFDMSILARHSPNSIARLSLSPEFNGFNDNLQRIFDYIKDLS